MANWNFFTFILSTCIFFLGNEAFSQTELVADIYTSGSGVSGSELTLYNGELYFIGQDQLNNRELWKSDGTAAGTVVVKELRASGSANPNSLTVAGNFLYFTAVTDLGGPYLFRTNGTSSGTVQITDNSYSSLNIRAVVNDQIYLTARKLIPGFGISTELYVLAGTGAPSRLTRYAENSSSGTFRDFIAFKNKLYMAFELPGDNVGVELYESDGTVEGTKLVADIYPGASDESFPENFAVLDNQLLFAANSGDGEELWITDGTTDGTQLLKDIEAGTADSSPRNLVTADNRVFFTASVTGVNREIFVTQGTAASTVLVKDVRNGSFSSGPDKLVAAGSNLFFDAFTDAYGSELWYSDGTETGTYLVKDINPGTGSSLVDNGYWYNGYLYFKAGDDTHGFELWVSDGTESGTQMFADVYPGGGSSTPDGFVFYKDHIYFIGTGLEGRELRRFTPLQIGGGNTIAITGLVFQEDSNDPGNMDSRIAGVTVTNQNNGLITTTDSNGEFSIEASDGDSLTFEKNDYNTTGIRVDFSLGTNYAVEMQLNPCIGINCPLGDICYDGSCFTPAFVQVNDANTNSPLIGAKITNLNNGFTTTTVDSNLNFFLYEIGDEITFELTGYMSDTLVAVKEYSNVEVYLYPAGQCDGISCSPEQTCFQGICETVITGDVKEAGSNFPVNGALLENLTKGVSTYVNLDGKYILPAETGDQIRVTAQEYEEFVFILPQGVSVYNVSMINFGLCESTVCPLGQICYNGSCYDPILSNTVVDENYVSISQPLITDIYTQESFRASNLGTFNLPEPNAYLNFSKVGYKSKTIQFENGKPFFVVLEKELCTDIICPLGQICDNGSCYDPLVQNQADVKVTDFSNSNNISGITIGEIGISGNEQVTNDIGEVTITFKGGREFYTYDPTGEYQNITFSINSESVDIKLVKAGCENVDCGENDVCYRGICGAPQPTTYSGYIYRPDSLPARGMYFTDDFDASAYSGPNGYFELTTPLFFDSIAVEVTKNGFGKFLFYLYPNQTNILQTGSIDPCSGIQCPLGQICYQGSCYNPCPDGNPNCSPADNDLCNEVICPLGKICYNGSCYNPCNLDGENLCGENLDENLCDGITCPLGMFCENGICYDPCVTDEASTTLCFDNVIDPCEGITPPAGYTCINGVVIPDCSSNSAACTTSAICSTVACLPGEPCFQCVDPSGENTSGLVSLYGSLNLTPFVSGGRTEDINASIYVFIENVSDGRKVSITRTDENGEFTMDSIPEGEYRLTVVAKGYYIPSDQENISIGTQEDVELSITSSGRMINIETTRISSIFSSKTNKNAWYPVPNKGSRFYMISPVDIKSLEVFTIHGSQMEIEYELSKSEGKLEMTFLSQPLPSGFYIFKWEEEGDLSPKAQTVMVLN